VVAIKFQESINNHAVRRSSGEAGTLLTERASVGTESSNQKGRNGAQSQYELCWIMSVMNSKLTVRKQKTIMLLWGHFPTVKSFLNFTIY